MIQIQVTTKRRITVTKHNDDIRVTMEYQDTESSPHAMENMLQMDKDTAIATALVLLDMADANNMLMSKHRPK